MVRTAADAHDVLVDVLAHRALLLDGRGNLDTHFADLVDPTIDALQRARRLFRLLDAVHGLLTAALHDLHRLACAALQRGDHAVDLLSRLLGPRCQVAHLVGDHGEAAALFTRACRLDGGIEGQQVGLLGNAADDVQHLGDVVAVHLQFVDHLTGLLDVQRQLADGGTGAIDHLGAGRGFAIGTAGGFGGALCVAGHLLHADCHLVDRGGDLVRLDLLTGSALCAALHRAEQLLGVLAELAGRIADAPDHGAGLGFQHLHGEGDLAEIVAAAGIDQLAHRVVADPPRLFDEPLQGGQRKIGQGAGRRCGDGRSDRRECEPHTTQQRAGEHDGRAAQRRQQRDPAAYAQRGAPQCGRRAFFTQLRI